MAHRMIAVLATAALGVSVLSGCASSFSSSSACIDWVYFETPADAAESVDAVVIGSVVDQAGRTSYDDMPATMWTVAVEDWQKGSGPDELIVTSLPRSCGDTVDSMAEYQDTSPLVFFLQETESGWTAVTPFQGVVPAASDGTIPETWPDDLYETPGS